MHGCLTAPSNWRFGWVFSVGKGHVSYVQCHARVGFAKRQQAHDMVPHFNFDCLSSAVPSRSCYVRLCRSCRRILLVQP